MGLKKNISYSVILTLSTYLVPLFVYPYVTRVLGPAGIGYVDKVDSLIDYCVLFSMMGLTTIGIREVARCRSDKAQLQKTFSSLFALNLLSTAVVLAVLGVLVLTVPSFHDRSRMFLIGMTKIVSNLFWIEWFYKGLENFRYITIRSVILRLLFIAAVYLFVKEETDVMVYYILWVGLTFGNAVCNWSYKNRFTRFSLRDVSLADVWKPVVLIGLFAVFSAIYTKLNVFFLGEKCGDTQVGYYTASTRLYSVLIALFTSVTSVMIPRMSVLLKEGQMQEVRSLTTKTFSLLFMFAFPVLIFFELFAPEFIMLFTGMDFRFAGAVIPMRIVMCQLFVIGSEQIFILQLLVPSGHDRHAVLCAIAGALVCVVANILLLPGMGAVGSAIAWVSAECTVLVIASVFVKKFLSIEYPFRLLLKNLLWSVPYLLLGVSVLLLVKAPLMRLGCGAVLFSIWFLLVEEKVLKLGILGMVLSKLKKD